ncbi:hypothetical protein QQ045_033121 [Rhodiola kirilowii]
MAQNKAQIGYGPTEVDDQVRGGLKKVWEEDRKWLRKMGMMVLEALLPLGIIAGMLCVMGNAQYYIHKAAHGRPKHIGNDMWDVAMERRDKKIVEQFTAPQN